MQNGECDVVFLNSHFYQWPLSIQKNFSQDIQHYDI